MRNRIFGVPTIQQKIERLYRWSGMSKLEFAKRAGLAESPIRSILQGHEPRSSVAVKIARAFDLSLDWLCSDDCGWADLRPIPRWLTELGIQPGLLEQPAGGADAVTRAESAAAARRASRRKNQGRRA